MNPDPKCAYPVNPNKFYLYRMYATFFFGPFDSLQEVSHFFNEQCRQDNNFDSDSITCCKGSDPLPDSYRDLRWIKNWWIPYA